VVARVISTGGAPPARPQPSSRIATYVPFILDTLRRYPGLLSSRLYQMCPDQPCTIGHRKRRRAGTGWRAGVREYWLVDARGERPELAIHSSARNGFQRVRAGRDGFARSDLLGVAVKLVALPPRAGLVRHRLLRRS
jgi:hypothetical protein